MNIVEYKGFQGQVEWEDDTLYITVLHVPDTLISQCDNASEVEHAFKELIDDYLALCEEAQIEASKPFSGTFNVRISPELHREAVMAAKREGSQSLNRWVECAIQNELHPTNNHSYSFIAVPVNEPAIARQSASRTISFMEKYSEGWQQIASHDFQSSKRSDLEYATTSRTDKVKH